MQEQQGVIQLRGDADAIAIEVRPGFACIQCVTIREGQVLASNSFFHQYPKKDLMKSGDMKIYGNKLLKHLLVFII